MEFETFGQDDILVDYVERFLREISSQIEKGDRVVFYFRHYGNERGPKDKYNILGSYEASDSAELRDAEFRSHWSHWRHTSAANHIRSHHKGKYKWCATIPQLTEKPKAGVSDVVGSMLEQWMPTLQELASDPKKLKATIIELSAIVMQK